jgi:hypothetical protein
MTTVRELRIKTAKRALVGCAVYGIDVDYLAERVVDALFTADPLIDNAKVPE